MKKFISLRTYIKQELNKDIKDLTKAELIEMRNELNEIEAELNRVNLIAVKKYMDKMQGGCI